MSFENLLPTLVAGLEAQGITTPTEIQARTLGPLLAGASLIGVSETGSGKTLAFALPVLHQLKSLELHGSSVTDGGRPRAVVVVPARELGEQVSRELKKLTHTTRVRVRTALGGSAKQVSRQNVKGAHEVLVATPGRLVKLLDAGSVVLSDVRVLVFDEADQVLDPGFLPVAKRLLDECPDDVQRVLFSATVPDAVDRIVEELFETPPLRVETSGSGGLVATLRTENVAVPYGNRQDLLYEVLSEEPDAATLLFVNTREQCDRVSHWLDQQDIEHLTYRGEMGRVTRRANLALFRDGPVNILLATDLAGRGLDIERVTRVINVHLPRDIDNYLHRAGRTARAGRTGTVVNFVTERDAPLMAKVRQL